MFTFLKGMPMEMLFVFMSKLIKQVEENDFREKQKEFMENFHGDVHN